MDPDEVLPPAPTPELNAEIDQEIENHGKTWCDPDCPLLLQSTYRQLRRDGIPAEKLQADFDACHLWT